MSYNKRTDNAAVGCAFGSILLIILAWLTFWGVILWLAIQLVSWIVSH